MYKSEKKTDGSISHLFFLFTNSGLDTRMKNVRRKSDLSAR